METSIEDKWRRKWEEARLFEANPDLERDKVFVTVPFPYMNGPLHVGTAFTTLRVDAFARFKRMQGVNTLFPYAWHWTGQPLVAAAERLARNDPAMLREFVEIEKVPADEISKFYDPVYMAEYYTKDGRESLKRLGVSIDWRREFHTTDLEPAFNKFVLWQMKKLRDKGYISRGSHPVIWCPRDQSPTGDHDRLSGEGVTWQEFTLVLFPSSSEEGLSLPAATLRPETIFAVTNLWINPTGNYVEAKINSKQRWLISSRAAEKLREQLKKIEIMREFSGRELVGSKVLSPVDSTKKLVVLPGDFVDPDNGTGLVYGVPAHAPADYIALQDLKNSWQLLTEFQLDQHEIEAITPIAMISVSGMGEYPAAEIVKKMEIKNQSDPRLEEATQEVYKKEFHQGIMRAIAGKFEGKRVSEVKDLVIEDLKQKGVADSMYELPQKVICRCQTECIVKILEDQWFLRYSDPAWKKLAHECIDQASIYPESCRQWFHDVIEWYRDWPCARRHGLGTPLPWSPGWIVETLSDSTIYMAFYTIRARLREDRISPDSLTESFFDYVYLGIGNPEEVSKETLLDEETIRQFRDEFLYWYPVNLRNSAKELIPNHLTFFVFQHVAFFSKELWPTGISANGMLTREGAKMSKSKGNLVSMKQAIDQYGPDVVRASLLGAAEGLDDADWREGTAKDIQSKIDLLVSFIISIKNNSYTDISLRQEEYWLESEIQKRISNVTSNLEQMKTKSAFQEAFYNFWNDIRYYLKRTDRPSKQILTEATSAWIRLLSPFIPYTCEQINSQLGNGNFVSVSRFPTADPDKVHPSAELKERIIKQVLADATNISKLMKAKLSQLYLYIAPSWHYMVFRKAVESRKNNTKMNETLAGIFAVLPETSRKEIANLLPRITKELNEFGDDFVSDYESTSDALDETKIYEGSISYFERELGVKLKLFSSDESAKYDPKDKAKFTLPFKPALYFE